MEMTDYKNANFEDLISPKFFFATFHTEYAYHKALEVASIDYLGETVKVKQATEPTDIIWEHKHFRRGERTIRWVLVVIIMIGLAFGAFMAIVWLLKRKLLITYLKNPPGVDCSSVTTQDNLSDLQQLAYKEAQQWAKIDPYDTSFNTLISRQGSLKCFCDYQGDKGFKSDHEYKVRGDI